MGSWGLGQASSKLGSKVVGDGFSQICAHSFGLLQKGTFEQKVPSEMEVAPHYKLLSLMVTPFTWFDTVDLVDTVETAE